MMKSWHPSLPSFNPFVIVFYFLFRRLAKRAAPVKKTNDYDYDHAAYPGYQIDGPHAEYVQLFSWSVVASILNCFYRIFIKKRKRKDPSRAIYTRLWTLLSEKLCIKTVRRNLLKFYYVYLVQWLKCLIIKGTVFEFFPAQLWPTIPSLELFFTA